MASRSIEQGKKPEYSSFGHTFHVIKEKAGFLGLGKQVEMLEHDEVVGKFTVYGDTFRILTIHQMAEVNSALSPKDPSTLRNLMQTNNLLPKRLQRPHF